MSVYFSGMISGLDTEQLIQQLMALERRPITLMQQKLSRIEEQQAAWRDVNTRLSNLEGKLEDLLGTGVFDAMKATSTDESVATATVTAAAAAATYDLVVSKLAQNDIVAGAAQAAGTTTTADGTLTLQIGSRSTDVTITSGSTLQDVADAINDADAGIRASVVNVDGVNERLVLEGLTTGSTEQIAVSGDSSLVGLDTLESLRQAQDAEFSLNGLAITRSTNEISDVVEGVTFTLKTGGDAQATITVGQDVDAAVSKIKAFVDQYNSFYTFAQEKLAKEAILQGDTALIQLVSRVRTSVTDRVASGDDLDQLALIGITTTREGTLTLDESLLREKLAEDPLAVERLFTAEEGTDGFTGVARRAVSIIEQYTRSSGLISSRQSMYSGMIDDINDQIDSLEMRLDLREANMRAQFVRMEQMLATLNAQASALQGQLAQISALASGGGGSAG